jgi:hypothetical protein
MARFVRAYRKGLLSQEVLAAISAELPHVTAGHVVSEVAAVQR